MKATHKHLALPLKHVGSFTLLFLLATLRPTSIWPEAPYLFEPIILLVLASLLLYKIHATIGYTRFWQINSTTILLIIAYQTICLLSLWINRERYAGLEEFIRWGLSFVVIQGVLPTAIFLFSLPQNTKGWSLSRNRYNWAPLLIITLLIPSVAFWQIIDNASAYQFYQYFIAGDVGRMENTRSILAISTDLGAISGILCITAGLIAIRCLQQGYKFIALLLTTIAIINLIGGLASTARAFILMLATAIISGIFFYFIKNWKILLISMLTGISSLLFIVQLMPYRTAYRLFPFLPAIAFLNNGIPIIKEDFIPSISLNALADRAELWQRVTTTIHDNLLIGVSNGGFRIINSEVSTILNNTHNIFLQVLIDAGIIGFLLFLALGITTTISIRKKITIVLILSTISSLLVDNFADHSFPWLIILSFSIATLNNFNITPKTSRCTHRTYIYSLALAGLSIISTYWIRNHKLNIFYREDIATKIERTWQAIQYNYGKASDPIILSSRLANILRQTAPNKFKLFNPVEISACNYSYPNGRLFFYQRDQQGIAMQRILENDNKNYLGETNTNSIKCSPTLNNPLAIKYWLSNHSTFLNNYRKRRHKLILRSRYIDLWSTVFENRPNQCITFLSHGEYINIPPILHIQIISAKTDSILIEKSAQLNRKKTLVTTLSPENQELIFIKLKLKDNIYSKKKKEHQSIYLEKVYFQQPYLCALLIEP